MRAAAQPPMAPPPDAGAAAGGNGDGAEALQALQDRFLAHMSHELHTPLAGLLGLVDLARRVATDPAQRRYLEVAMQSGRALQRSIAQVLEFARLREGPLPLAEDAFDLAEAVAEVLRTAMPRVRRKGLSMRYDWEGEPTWVRGDELRVRQIVGNLVDNAARFTEHGHVALRARLDDDRARPGGRRFELQIEDSGPGVAPALAGRIFDDFVQGDDSLTRAHGGTGLGLPIARALARRMGGDVVLASVPGAGSRFTLTLALDAAPDPQPLADPAPGHAWIVYPQPDAGVWMQRRFARLGWTSEVVSGIQAALGRAAQLAPHERPPPLVVVAEQALHPDADLDALRAVLPASDIRLLIRPDWQQPALEQRALALGMRLDVRPLTPRALRLMTTRGTAAPPALQVPPAPRPGPHLLVVEDNPTNRMIAEAFLDALALPWRSVGDGAQALADCAAAPPRLVLMDLQMPVMDGLTACRELRARQARGELPRFPIVALTAHAMASDAEACRDAGMDGFLTKPLLLDTLRDELARWCEELRA
ncbi:MAG: response regulator [Burkholderiales bacterium]|nr:response regulator [Burkholderiales bacterium]